MNSRNTAASLHISISVFLWSSHHLPPPGIALTSLSLTMELVSQAIISLSSRALVIVWCYMCAHVRVTKG